MTQTQGPSHPPGWHPDPWGQAEFRWWDGSSWTEQTRSSSILPPPGARPQPQALQQTGLGILYLLFVWTFIPAIIAFIERIIYLVQDDATSAPAQGLTYAP